MTAEPPLQVESREELAYLLGEACEIEHGLMCRQPMRSPAPSTPRTTRCAARPTGYKL